MKKSTVIELRSAGASRDALTEVLRQGARRLLAEALEAEVQGSSSSPLCPRRR